MRPARALKTSLHSLHLRMSPAKLAATSRRHGLEGKRPPAQLMQLDPENSAQPEQVVLPQTSTRMQKRLKRPEVQQ